MNEFAKSLSDLKPSIQPPWDDWVKKGHKNYQDFTINKGNMQDADLAGIMKWLSKTLPDDTIVSFGAGNYTQWIQRYFSHNLFGTQVATQSAIMGYSVPAAISAGMLYPEKTILSFAGDGCFLMNGQEIATAIRYNTNVKFIVINNSRYGSIQMHQEKRFPERSIAVELTNPDFAALARAYGIPAMQVKTINDFIETFTELNRTAGPALIEIITDPDVITPSIMLSDLRKG
jgi:acetolactate synthase-1/2/3 large subunit